MTKRKVLIAGALGTVGRSALAHFTAQKDVEVIGLSRRAPDFETSAKWIPVDLTDAEAQNKIAEEKGITHIVYAALYEKPSGSRGWVDSDHIEVNLQMMRNVIEGVEKSSPELKHVTVIHGTKQYGGHLGPFRMPARESDPRYMSPNFYYNQHDWITDHQRGKDWTWTILRPQLVCGNAIGSPLNVVTGIGVYAAISKELGIPLRFPGGPQRVGEASDARLIAKAADWAGRTPAAGNEAFNVANGDVYIWEHVWPSVAELFKMKQAPHHPTSLNHIMPGNEEVWNRIVKKHGLLPYSFKQMVPSWQMIDWLFGHGQRPNPHHTSTIKIRKFGFHECVDTEEMFIELLTDLQNQKILPSY